MSELDELGQARRRLAGLLLGTPWAAAFAAGTPAPAATSATSAAAAAATADGEVFTGRWVHAFAMYGAPKYAPDFKHFEYVNPDAPKTGTIRLKNPDRRTSFDKYNPWTTRGNAPAGVLIWMAEGMCHMGQDEPSTMYGLLAEALMVAPDFGSVTFRLNLKARFNNGDPVTPEDVVHSLKMLSSKQALPSVQTGVSGLERAVVVDARTVRFDLAEKTRGQVFIAGTMPVFSRKWGGGKPFDEIVSDYPILTGPYLIDKSEMPRRIEFKRNPEYWAKDLPVRRGHFNFERAIYRNYLDNVVALEAFKAGEFEIMKEYRARGWVRQHAGLKWDDGRILKAPMPTRFGFYLQSFNLNARRAHLKDPRVREALSYTYDFARVNRAKTFKRANSMFNNSEFAAQGSPSAGELALLEPFRAELPPRVFGPAYEAPQFGTPELLRKNLLQGRELLEQAGWKPDADGTLRNAEGEAFVLEFMDAQMSDRVDWIQNCKKLGIEFRQRVVDYALFTRRLKAYDFDMVTIAEGAFTLPEVAELTARCGSRAADEEGNDNYRGIKSRAVDALLQVMANASTMDELRTAARALDRVVMWGHYQIVDLYQSNEQISYWNRFGKPAKSADYFRADTMISGFTEHGPWPLWTWWVAEKKA